MWVRYLPSWLRYQQVGLRGGIVCESDTELLLRLGMDVRLSPSADVAASSASGGRPITRTRVQGPASKESGTEAADEPYLHTAAGR